MSGSDFGRVDECPRCCSAHQCSSSFSCSAQTLRRSSSIRQRSADPANAAPMIAGVFRRVLFKNMSMAVALLALVLLVSSVAPTAAAEVLLDGTGTESEAADADIVDINGNGNENTNRVFGGKDAKFQRYQYMAHIYNKDGRPYCAGTLITPTYILSAAHCADDDSTPAYVIIGKHSRLYYQNEPNVERIDIKKKLVHPDHQDGYDWINDHILNDIVLLQLKAPSRHTPVKLSFDANRLQAGIGLRVMGWGTTSYDRTRPDELQIADVNYIPNAVCEKSKGKIRPTSTYDKSYAGYITDDMICAASKNKDACSGDSGGPLIIPGNSPAQDLVVGVVSWGECPWVCYVSLLKLAL